MLSIINKKKFILGGKMKLGSTPTATEGEVTASDIELHTNQSASTATSKPEKNPEGIIYT